MIKSIELFAGCGGLALGMESAGIKNYAMVEVDKNACETLRSNFDKNKVFQLDITKIKSFKKELCIKNEIDIISGGFPCQSFSYAGKGLGFADTRGTLFSDMARAVKEISPKIIIAENVKGLSTHDSGKTLKVIVEKFRELGYTIYSKVLNSNDFGVAQKRERIFIIGIRNDIHDVYGEYQFPKPLEYKPVLRDVLQNVPLEAGVEYPKKKYEILDQVPPGGCWRDLPDDVARKYMMKSYHLGGGRTGIARRQSFDEPGLTVLTSPSQKQTERCHPEETRPFTTRENARIQSFPDEFLFKGSTMSIYKQIGNAVPVKLAEHVSRSIIEYLEGE